MLTILKNVLLQFIHREIIFFFLCFWKNKIIKPTVILWNIITIKTRNFYFDLCSNVIYSCDAQLYFQHHYSSLQCHMIFRNHANHDIFFRIIWWIKSPKEQHLFEIENMNNSIYEIVLIHHDHLFLSQTLNLYIFVIDNI